MQKIKLHLKDGETFEIHSKDHAGLARDLHVEESATHEDLEKKLKAKNGTKLSHLGAFDIKGKKTYDGKSKKPPKKKKP